MKRPGRPASDRVARRPARAADEAGTSGGMAMLQALLGFNVRRAQVVLSRDFQQHVGQGRVRPVVFCILVLAEAQPGIAQVDLTHRLALDKASVVALIDRIEGAGLVERRRSTLDRRRQGLFLTPLGSQRLKSLKEEVARHERGFLERYSAEELAMLIGLLRRLYE
jgi:MarR family transcriptional regulator, organic hydroperoxide resistance regulator